MAIQMEKVCVKAPFECLCQKIGLVWHARGVWDDRLTRSPNHNIGPSRCYHYYSMRVMAENLVYDIGYQMSWRERISTQILQ